MATSTRFTLRSGDGKTSGDRDARFLLGAPPGPFVPADFAAARVGTPSYVIAPDAFWEEHLTGEPRANWIGTGNSKTASETALFAVDFTLGPDPVTRATLTFRYLTDNFLGDANNEGVFINGTPLAGSKLLPQVAANYDTDQACATFDVTSELRSGANTLYVYGVGAGSVGDPTGLQFCATFEVVQGPSNATLPRVVTLRTGNGAIGGSDAKVRYLAGPAGGGFGRVLTASDFAAAATGPFANVIAPDGGWRQTLAADSAARWIGTGATAASSATGLFSLEFTLGSGPIASATLDARCLVDNLLGDSQNAGLFLNGTPLPGSKLLSQVAANYETDQVFSPFDVSGIVVPGLNRLQIYMIESPGGSPAGVQLTARLEVVSGSPPPIVRSVTPATGGAGTAVTIRGLAFPTGATVTVGGAPLTNVVVVNATTITGKTSTVVAGRGDVVVTGSSGRGTLVEGFEVP